METLLNTKAGQIVAGAVAALVFAFLAYVGIVFHVALGWMGFAEICMLFVLLNVAITVALLRWHHAPHVVRDKKDAPVRVVDGQALELPPYPASLTTLTLHYDPRIRNELAEPAPAAELLPTLPRAEPFYRIREQIAPGHLILGYNVAGAIPGDLTDLLSTAIVGRPGTGKTTALRFVCAQLLKAGGTPMMMDPHGSIIDELGDVLTCAESPQAIEGMARAMENELDRRLEVRRSGQQVGGPILLLADEWPVISRMAPKAVEVAGRIVLEGRKVGMYALISGQGLPSEQLGGSLVRDALSSRYVFNTTPAQARMAGMDNETAKLLITQLDTAGPGYAILASAKRRAEIVAIPDTTTGDVRALLTPVPLFSLSARQVSVPPKTTADEERERITQAIKEHPDWSNARIMQALGYRNNNKLSLIKSIREEGLN